MKPNLKVFAFTAVLGTTLALPTHRVLAHNPPASDDGGAALIASRLRFETVDLSALSPLASALPVSRVEPRPDAARNFTFDWTSSTVSYLVYVESTTGEVTISLPSGPERPYSTGPTASFVYPGGDEAVTAGKYGFTVDGGGSAAATVKSQGRVGSQPSSGILDLNLFVLEGCGLTTTGLSEGLAVFDDVYRDAGIRLGNITVVKVTGASSFLSPGTYEEAESAFRSLSRQLTASPPNRLAANLFFTKRVANVYGYSQGIPAALGILGTSSGGVVISIEAHLTDGGFDSREFGLTMAHEVGHSMGLYHTSESDGSLHDTISDTPRCAGGDAGGCPDGSNIMFWSGTFPEITSGQAFVLRRSPIVR